MSLKFEPLNILIVGAGLGGLFASLALRQDGHRITLLDASAEFKEARMESFTSSWSKVS